ncbi:MAG: hypothetical protein GY951_15175 [Psychromonas sp.]|nr:hypothetical protein [Psychromonas sp.]
MFAYFNSSNAFSDEVYVVTLNRNFTELSKNQVKMIFRGKSTTLSGRKISLLDLSENSDIRASFYKNLLRKNATQMEVQWASLAFSGKLNTPKELPSDDFSLVISWLKENPNGLAYYSAPLTGTDINVLYKQDIK